MKYAPVLVALALASTPVLAKDLSFVGQDYPPFNWNEGGEVKGGMVEVMKKACEKLKHNCKFGIVPLARAMQMLEEGSIDGVLSLIPNADRAKFANFSPTLVVSNLSYFGAKGKAKKVGSLNDLEGWTVGAVRASSSLKLAVANQKQLKNMTVVEEVNNETLIKKLQGDRYGDKGAIIGGDAVLEFEARKAKLDLELILGGEAQGFTTAFSKKSVDAATLAELTKTLEAMKKSGEVKTILDKFSLKTDQ
ncbi:MAG: transporter substrate-binding domain-containing protein [Pseudomonadota bacterium]